MNYEEFESIVLTPEYEHLGSALADGLLKDLLLEIEKIPLLLYTSIAEGGAVINDIYGSLKLQHIGKEDRLLFRSNHAHVHVQWKAIKKVTLSIVPGYPGPGNRSWVGLLFLDKSNVELFSLWNAKPDLPFSDAILDLLKQLG
jgi:hypothetical protein